MAKKVFAVYLAKEDVPNSEAYATLELPASPWELWDAMEKVRLKDGEALYMEIDDYYAFEYLAPHLEELDISLNELNDLAARLATLDEVQGIAFDGTVLHGGAEKSKHQRRYHHNAGYERSGCQRKDRLLSCSGCRG